MKKHKLLKYIIFTMVLILSISIVFSGRYAYADDENSGPVLTAEEIEYVKERASVNVLISSSVAPLEYTDKNGTPRGISIAMFKEIEKRTGLKFNFTFVDDANEGYRILQNGNADIISCIPKEYASLKFPQNELSDPYIKCKTVIYVNSSIDTDNLKDKIYAAVVGSLVPEGIDREKIKYYPSREASINAVERGDADYGYANEYTVSFYTIQNGLRNIIMVPTSNNAMEYSVLFIKPDSILKGIINKTIASINEADMDSIILHGSTDIHPNISLLRIFYSYEWEIIGIAAVIILLLIIGIVFLYRYSIQMKLQHKKFIKLTEIADEYLLEYDNYRHKLSLSNNFKFLMDDFAIIEYASTSWEVIDSPKAIIRILTGIVQRSSTGDEISFTLKNGTIRMYRIVTATINVEKNKMGVVIAKLEDISRENAEKKVLMEKASRDSMTDLLNSEVCKNTIGKLIENGSFNKKGVLILIDIDNFKVINDNYGHPAGDEVIKALASILISTFRTTDIVGRLGGDEFCVYMHGAMTRENIDKQILRFKDTLKKDKTTLRYHTTVSIGIMKASGVEDFNTLYVSADKALYKAKNSGRNCHCYYHNLDK